YALARCPQYEAGLVERAVPGRLAGQRMRYQTDKWRCPRGLVSSAVSPAQESGIMHGNWFVASAVLTLLLAWLVIRWLSTALDSISRRSTRARFFVKWLQPVFRIAIWFAALIACFNFLAPSRETFLASIASFGIALGLGAQDLIKNLVGGLVVLGDRPYQLGDRVRIGDAYGEIDHIGLRSTKLTTPDDTRVTIPNAQVLTDRVFNANSGVPDCQVVTDLFLPVDSSPDLAQRVGFEAAICSPFLLARKPVVILTTQEFNRRPYLRLRIKCYVYDHRFEPRIQSDITARASRELSRHGILQQWRPVNTSSS
ncbi:MAG: mechanosensitive ion channel domain-containing protein, partial [Bryobacteraceae bacterium]